MGSLERRLTELEARSAPDDWQLGPEELRGMSRGELEELEDLVEAEVARGERSFWDLYAIITVKNQQGLEPLFAAMEAGRISEREAWTPQERRAACEEALRKTSSVKNGYRIWRYYRGGQMPEALRQALYGEGATM